MRTALLLPPSSCLSRHLSDKHLQYRQRAALLPQHFHSAQRVACSSPQWEAGGHTNSTAAMTYQGPGHSFSFRGILTNVSVFTASNGYVRLFSNSPCRCILTFASVHHKALTQDIAVGESKCLWGMRAGL